MNGLEFQAELKKAGIFIPIIFVTAHGDVPMTSRAMKAGAIEFLMKPFQKEELLAAIHQGLERDRLRREEEAGLSILQSRFEELTPREREVMKLVVAGLTNKEVASNWESVRSRPKCIAARLCERCKPTLSRRLCAWRTSCERFSHRQIRGS